MFNEYFVEISIQLYSYCIYIKDLYGMCGRMGKLKDIDKFDGLFFGIFSTMGDSIDPQSRILLETTYEAIVDAGMQ